MYFIPINVISCNETAIDSNKATLIHTHHTLTLVHIRLKLRRKTKEKRSASQASIKVEKSLNALNTVLKESFNSRL